MQPMLNIALRAARSTLREGHVAGVVHAALLEHAGLHPALPRPDEAGHVLAGQPTLARRAPWAISGVIPLPGEKYKGASETVSVLV